MTIFEDQVPEAALPLSETEDNNLMKEQFSNWMNNKMPIFPANPNGSNIVSSILKKNNAPNINAEAEDHTKAYFERTNHDRDSHMKCII